MPTIPLRRQREKNQEFISCTRVFEASLGYMRPCLRKEEKKEGQKKKKKKKISIAI